MRIKCATLFNITRTGVTNRRTIKGAHSEELRSQQSNFETILQIIGLRSQPENITDPKLVESVIFDCGTAYTDAVRCWIFYFEIAHSSAYHNNSHELGNLFTDCNGVPMIAGLQGMCSTSIAQLNSASPLYKNIHFEVQNG
jgi:hypothetical protein